MHNWFITEDLSKLPVGNRDYGYCYAVKIPIIQGISLIKTGATTMPRTRLRNIGKRETIFCVSPPCLNYWENEELLHNYYSQFRIPSRPHKGVQAELFNISLTHLFKTMPVLKYETKNRNCAPTKDCSSYNPTSTESLVE